MIQSLVRAMQILEVLGMENRKYSIAEIAELTSMPSSTVHRILKTLLSNNYVSKDELTHLYFLGYALIPLGAKAVKHINIKSVAAPILNSLSTETQEDAYLIIKSGYKGLILDIVEGPHPLKIVDRYGPEVDLHCGAIRKALLAHQDESFVNEYIERGLAKYTTHTIIDPDQLRENLKEIRLAGVSSSIGEYISDAVGVGAPVVNNQGEAIASVGIIVPVSRIDDEIVDRFKKVVKEKANQISAGLGFLDSKMGNDKT